MHAASKHSYTRDVSCCLLLECRIGTRAPDTTPSSVLSSTQLSGNLGDRRTVGVPELRDRITLDLPGNISLPWRWINSLSPGNSRIEGVQRTGSTSL